MMSSSVSKNKRTISAYAVVFLSSICCLVFVGIGLIYNHHSILNIYIMTTTRGLLGGRIRMPSAASTTTTTMATYNSSSANVTVDTTSTSKPTPAPTKRTTVPYMVTSVMTYNRPESLKRVLNSLQNAHYYPLDHHDQNNTNTNEEYLLPMKIQLDAAKQKSKDPDEFATQLSKHRDCLQIAESYNWTHGPKELHLRARNAGLATQWFEAWTPLPTDDFWISIVEDDFEYSPFYFQFLLDLQKNMPLVNDDDRIVSICLTNAGDEWYNKGAAARTRQFVRVVPETNDNIRFTCSWGAIWKAQAFRDFKLWLNENLDRIEPLTNKPFNTWYKQGKDLQSIWTARYLFETNKKFIVFDLKQSQQDQGKLLVTNHREAGENYDTKQANSAKETANLLQDPSKLPSSESWKQGYQSLQEQLEQLFPTTATGKVGTTS